MDNIKDKVIKLIEELCLTKIQDTTQTLIGELAMDSLRMVMLLIKLEENFNIELDQSDMNPFSLITVDDVIALSSKYLSKGEK